MLSSGWMGGIWKHFPNSRKTNRRRLWRYTTTLISFPPLVYHCAPIHYGSLSSQYTYLIILGSNLFFDERLLLLLSGLKYESITFFLKQSLYCEFFIVRRSAKEINWLDLFKCLITCKTTVFPWPWLDAPSFLVSRIRSDSAWPETSSHNSSPQI